MTDMNTCPRCGAENPWIVDTKAGFVASPAVFVARCSACAYASGECNTIEQAIAAWNALPRSQPPGPKTLRDEFAMAALTGLMTIRDDDPQNDYIVYGPETAAGVAYAIADAMMKEREEAT